ncbi:heterogeneous nuclear ribonucleoprotein C-like isoform X1 [Numida meleagris]|uniref:heterogeneous nuclear ribonucleoprotein C-like isoform X1 n=1 Tax=Numida meleagris TaxID=8996 RepID=UPI000B3DECCE|nr:heterogeneous nuclear ribonucleoprotein C-like isoform X1 [Numida meleagris]
MRCWQGRDRGPSGHGSAAAVAHPMGCSVEQLWGTLPSSAGTWRGGDHAPNTNPITEPTLGMGTCGRRVSLPCSAAAADLLSSVPSRSSTCDLDYSLYRDDFPYRVYEYQKIPPLINRIPVKARRTHARAGGTSSPSPQHGARSSASSTGTRTKLRAEELHSIKEELSQIKARVDSLLESLERMDQRRERLSGCKESEKKRAEVGSASPAPLGEGSRGKEGSGGNGRSDLRNIDSAEESTDTEETVKAHTSDPEGSQ